MLNIIVCANLWQPVSTLMSSRSTVIFFTALLISQCWETHVVGMVQTIKARTTDALPYGCFLTGLFTERKVPGCSNPVILSLGLPILKRTIPFSSPKSKRGLPWGTRRCAWRGELASDAPQGGTSLASLCRDLNTLRVDHNTFVETSQQFFWQNHSEYRQSTWQDESVLWCLLRRSLDIGFSMDFC